jgi:hypothetical protein
MALMAAVLEYNHNNHSNRNTMNTAMTTATSALLSLSSSIQRNHAAATLTSTMTTTPSTTTPNTTTTAKKGLHLQNWEDKFSLLSKFKQVYGQCNVPEQGFKEKAFKGHANWMCNQYQ